MPKLTVIQYQGYLDWTDIVHTVLQIKQPMGDGHCFHYPTACGIDDAMQHIRYVDKPTTCLACIAEPYLWVKCTRQACRTKLPVEQMLMHTQNGAPYCPPCARRINQGLQTPLVIVQE